MNPIPFEEAIKFFRDKVVLSPGEYKKLIDRAKQRAFSVAGITEADILMDIRNEVLRGLEAGITFNDFKKAILPKVEDAWLGTAAYRLDTIFRTNIQSSYQAGHYQQQVDVVDDLPYWQYIAVGDRRTRPSHAARNGKVFRADDPWWDRNYPGIGVPFDWFNCRCTVRALTARQVEREGLKVEKKQRGTRKELLTAYEPDTTKYPDWLRDQVR